MAPGSALLLAQPRLENCSYRARERYSQVLGCYVSHCKSRGWFSAFQKKRKLETPTCDDICEDTKVTVPKNCRG